MTKADSPKPPTKLETITLKVFIHCEGCRRKVRRIIRVLDGVEDVTVDSASGKVTVTGTADVKTILQRLQKYGKHAEMWPNSIPTPPTAGKAGANQPKPNNNNGSDGSNKKKSSAGAEGGDKAAAAAENGSKKGDGKKEATPGTPAKVESVVNESKPEKGKEAVPEEASNVNAPTQNGAGGGGSGGGGKKGGKKGGNGNNTTNSSDNNNNSGGGSGNAPEVPFPPPPPPPVHDIPIMSAHNTSIAVAANKSLAPYDSIQTGYTNHSAEYATHMFSDENANNCSIM